MPRLSTVRPSLLLGLLCVGGASCTTTADAHEPRADMVAFESIVRSQSRLPLSLEDSARISMPVATLAIGSRVVVLDRKRAELRIFSRSTGELAALAGSAGDARGQLREPGAAAALDSGQFVVLDDGRRLLSFRDSLGHVLREVRLPEGSFNSIIPVPSERTIILAGAIYYAADSIRRRDLHEFDYAGHRIRSYGLKAEAKTMWATAFSAVIAAGTAKELVMGTMSSNVLRMIDRDAGTERSFAVAPGWYTPLEYPSDRVLKSGGNQQSASERVTSWTRQHRLLNGIFPLGGNRLLVRFQAFDPSGRRFYYYALTDRTGSAYVVTRPTRVNVLDVRGDTLYWVESASRGPAAFVTGVVHANAPGHIIASAAR